MSASLCEVIKHSAIDEDALVEFDELLHLLNESEAEDMNQTLSQGSHLGFVLIHLHSLKLVHLSYQLSLQECDGASDSLKGLEIIVQESQGLILIE